jgi:hypothetical protein
MTLKPELKFYLEFAILFLKLLNLYDDMSLQLLKKFFARYHFVFHPIAAQTNCFIKVMCAA